MGVFGVSESGLKENESPVFTLQSPRVIATWSRFRRPASGGVVPQNKMLL